ncbi:reticulon-4 receptor-like 2 [Ambystoma mexicanum]|uniref:reticulon-4 receptor-like 2 n=1 Tax=Ambystoma mexicanum TaxID=8296 RepID=UPI0037E97903
MSLLVQPLLHGPAHAALRLLLLLLACCPVLPSCPSLCTCYFSPPTVSCQSHNFSRVPMGIPANAQRIFLQNNLITDLRVGVFGPHTVTLLLYSNNITSIQTGAFWDLRSLEDLDLGENRNLRALDADTFRGLSRLQALHLYRCQLTSLPSLIFRRLYNLQYLYLQDNLLLYLQDDLFIDNSNLTHLFLHGNRLRVLSENVFRGLMGLDRLLLHMNRLHVIHRWAFRDLYKVTILYLFNNSLTTLSGETMADLPSLEFLRLNSNPWACDCRARSLWSWFRQFRVSSSNVLCMSPPERHGMDLRFLAEEDFLSCQGPTTGQGKNGVKAKWKPKASSSNDVAPVNGGTRVNGSSNNLYGLGDGRIDGGAPNPSTLYKDLPSNDIYSPKYDGPTEEDYWEGYGSEGELRENCIGLDCPIGGSSSLSQERLWIVHMTAFLHLSLLVLAQREH